MLVERGGEFLKDVLLLRTHGAVEIQDMSFFFAEGKMWVDADVGISEKIIDVCTQITRDLRKCLAVGESAVLDVAVDSVGSQVEIAGESALWDTQLC